MDHSKVVVESSNDNTKTHDLDTEGTAPSGVSDRGRQIDAS